MEKELKKKHAEYQMGLINKCDCIVEKIAKEIIDDLKIEASSYKELAENLQYLKRTLNFDINRPLIGPHIVDRINTLIEDEKNDLQITNRPK